jgi:hypothetical protein
MKSVVERQRQILVKREEEYTEKLR